jgi:hypothetical protein
MAAELGCSGAWSTRWFHGLSAGKTAQRGAPRTGDAPAPFAE